MNAHFSETPWSAERCAQLLSKAKRSPQGWKACCPAHEDSDPSLFLTDGDGGGLVLVCYAGCEYRDIAQALEAKGAVLSRSRHKRDEIPTEHYQLGRYHAYWDYRDATGRVQMRVCRWEQPEGKKDIRPIVRTDQGWKWAHHPTPRPLFQTDRLINEPSLPVIVVEGEKAAVAAQKLFPGYVATTWPGGASSVGQANWALLTGRNVVLIPDCDAPGRKAMEWVRQNVAGMASELRIVDPASFAKDLSDGWDLADALREGTDVSTWLDPPAKESQFPEVIDWVALAGKSPPDRDWAIKGWLGMGYVTLLAGPAGAGKTAVAQAIASALCLGYETVDEVIRPRTALCWFGEDDADEIWRRQIAVSAWLNVELGAFAGSLHISSLAREDITLMEPLDGVLRPTPRLRQLREHIGDVKAEFVCVDSVARTFGGNENDRHQVTAFITALQWALAPTNACLVLIGHPAKSQGSEFSGSTAWEASVRSRLYFGFRLPDNKEDAESVVDQASPLRFLAKRKTNYSVRDWRQVKWEDGVMKPQTPDPGMQTKGGRPPAFLAEEALRLLRRLRDIGIQASHAPNSTNFLPRAAAAAGLLNDGLSERDIRTGLATLLNEGRVKVGEVGRYAKGASKMGLVEVQK